MDEEMTTPRPKDSEEDLLQSFDSLSYSESIASSDSSHSLSPKIASNPSWLSDAVEDWDFTPLDKLTVFDVLDNLALPQRLEKINRTLNLQKHKEKVRVEYVKHKERVMRRTDKELYRLKSKYTKGLDELITRWNDTAAVSAREKISFVLGVSNVFITGFLAGGYPHWMHLWYSLQLIYFMPLRCYRYHKIGYQYFLADLCYIVNVLLTLSIWVFPNSRRLFISTYCLSYGNNAWAIAMWRNSLVFHSLDKVTTLFIHIMPPLVLHCLVHQLDPPYQAIRFPAISCVKSAGQYGLFDMIFYATFPYAAWQITYHFMITVRRAPQIKAGRPTSFTWLRRSYSKTWIGKLVLRLPENLQGFAFMLIQYCYALLTMLPCTIWFHNKPASAMFISCLGLWSVFNGATYYIDVFGKQFKKELEQLKKDAAKWQNSPEGSIGKIPNEELPVTGLVTKLPTADATGNKIASISLNGGGFGELKEKPVTGLVTKLPTADATRNTIASISLGGGFGELKEKHITCVEITTQVN